MPAADLPRGIPRTRRRIFREYSEAILLAVLLTLVVRTFVIQAYRIPSGSMRETLLEGDFLFVNKLIFGPEIPFTQGHLPALREPQRGDVVVFRFPRDPSRDFIKRVVGLPGETLEIRDGTVHLDGEPLEEPYAVFRSSRRAPENYLQNNIHPPGSGNKDWYGPVRIPLGHYFVMGDNRDESEDSRFWGFLDRNLFKGKAEFIHLSFDDRKLPRFSRMGRAIR
jgi:signal peptidase I